MPVRYRAKRRCRNCPETEEGLPKQSSQSTVVTYEGEGSGLWKAASVACGTLLELLFRYVVLDVPGKPLPQLERLHTRLGEIIRVRREKEQQNVSEDDGASPADQLGQIPGDSNHN